MEDLRRLFEEQGFTQVSTFIASGNVIFTARAKPDALASGMTRPSVKLVVIVEVCAEAVNPHSSASASSPGLNPGNVTAPSRLADDMKS